jgi:hypothetical protein
MINRSEPFRVLEICKERQHKNPRRNIEETDQLPTAWILELVSAQPFRKKTEMAVPTYGTQ